MYKILVVDDEKNIRELVKEYAEFLGHEVTEASNGMDAVELCRSRDFDVIIMDVMMPKADGFTASKEIHKFKQIPIIMLSARGEEYDKLYGFEVGVDDYVVKPFSLKELMARISVVVERRNATSPEKNIKEFIERDGIRIETAGRNVYIDGELAEISRKGYDLLIFLIENEGVVLSREKILDEVWGYTFLGEDRTIDTHIKMLRGILGQYREYIKTLRGVGYKFES